MTGPFEHILVPLDGSRLAEAALPAVRVLARCTGARVTVMHVVERGAPKTVHGEPHLTSIDAAEAYLESVAGQFAGADYVVEWHVHPNEENDVVASIAAHAAEFGVDLIALCAHGWGGVRDLLAGSIAQQVLRSCTQPVFLVRPTPSGDPPDFGCRRILVPLGGGQEHEAALDTAAALAKACGAPIHLLKVVPTVATVTGDNAAVARLVPTATAMALDAAEQEAARYLNALASRLRADGPEAIAEVGRGDPASLIVEYAVQSAIDLIVMATHARAGLDAFWFNSVAPKVMSRFPQPVLLIRV